ncbi:DinB family protein [Spirosoma sordidisoli]|uniref:DinB family protein n=1 Tax=Spirosoma sordidisoli TaxID=2502893 RepID=A0A4Q2UIK2_9BACT|nr:DinB family protein [Spirosoma sordidisoli]RYC67341.1 DinB family protein [Spirosoma sordidisoli]
MTKSDIAIMPQFFDRYINLADDIDLLTALAQPATFDGLIPAETLLALGNQVYAPGKWTVRDIVQHVIDNERIMSYRAMRFARNDKTPLPGYDEELFGQQANANRRSLSSLLEEFALVRQSSLALFRSLDDEALQRTGVCYNQTISSLALGFVLVGHALHHARIIQERYVPLLTGKAQ